MGVGVRGAAKGAGEGEAKASRGTRGDGMQRGGGGRARGHWDAEEQQRELGAEGQQRQLGAEGGGTGGAGGVGGTGGVEGRGRQRLMEVSMMVLLERLRA